MRWTVGRTIAVVLAPLVVVNYVPEALAFPYKQRVAGVLVRSTAPMPGRMSEILARSDALDKASPLGPIPYRRLFLTDGGWRWRLLSLTANGAFALTRPLSSAIVVNRSDIPADAVWNGADHGGRRTLAGVIAHETTHLMITRRYGLRALAFPSWKVEGYADHVARESSLSDADAAAFRRDGKQTAALVYYDGRRRVEQALAGRVAVDHLFLGR